jgi:hypothetical protein
MRLRAICFFALTVAFSGAALCQTFAAMSLVGYEMTVIQAGHSTGTSRDTNVHEALPMPDRAFDLAALRAVDQAMRKARPEAKVVLLAGRDPAWAAAAKQDLGVGSTEFDALTRGLAKAAEQAGAQQLIVVLPARLDLRMRVEQGTIGRGRGAGIGLYVDRDTPLRSADNREVANGFLGVFANFRVAVIEAPSGRVLADDTVSAGMAYSAARSKDGDIMNVLSGQQKVQAIEQLLRTEIGRVLPPLLARTT